MNVYTIKYNLLKLVRFRLLDGQLFVAENFLNLFTEDIYMKETL